MSESAPVAPKVNYLPRRLILPFFSPQFLKCSEERCGAKDVGARHKANQTPPKFKALTGFLLVQNFKDRNAGFGERALSLDEKKSYFLATVFNESKIFFGVLCRPHMCIRPIFN